MLIRRFRPDTQISHIGPYCVSSLDISDVLAEFFRSSAVFTVAAFFGGFSAEAKNSADPDVQRRLGNLLNYLDSRIYQ